MARIQALKEIRYGGENYQPGDVFDAKDREAKVLVAIGKAKVHQIVIEETYTEPVQEAAEAPVPFCETYHRRDMVAATGPTGEAISSPSSRRGRPRKMRTSQASEGDAE
jgi:hypothetical protein